LKADGIFPRPAYRSDHDSGTWYFVASRRRAGSARKTVRAKKGFPVFRGRPINRTSILVLILPEVEMGRQPPKIGVGHIARVLDRAGD